MKGAKIQNPFILSGYVHPDYFCNRDNETKRLISALENGRNTTLISIRKIGKSNLIKHVFFLKRDQKHISTLYFDLWKTSNLDQFIQKFGNLVLVQLYNQSTTWGKKIVDHLGGIRIKISYDPVTGMPFIEFFSDSIEEKELTLEKIFGLIPKLNNRVYIALDEFQQINTYPEKNMEALIRSVIQDINNATFIFSGSRKGIMTSMFTEYSRPFYQSTEIMYLDKINQRDYKEFIKKQFRLNGQNITDTSLSSILEFTRCHTFYVQFICNKLYGCENKRIDLPITNQIIEESIKESEMVHFNLQKILPALQFNVLRSIAIEGRVDKPTSQRFLTMHKLGSPSSVQSAIQYLLEKEFIHEEDGGLMVTDAFLSAWLKRL